MKLPRGDAAIVELAKVRHYLLSAFHPIGRFKAAFFRSIGYTAAEWHVLELDLRALAAHGDAIAVESTTSGQKYEVRGNLQGPSGARASVVTVWIVLAGEDLPRFVTVYPAGGA